MPPDLDLIHDTLRDPHASLERRRIAEGEWLRVVAELRLRRELDALQMKLIEIAPFVNEDKWIEVREKLNAKRQEIANG